MQHETTPRDASAPPLLRGTELDRRLDALAAGGGLALRALRTAVLEAAGELLREPEGLGLLAERVPRFVEAGLFADGPWAEPARLQAPLVAATLRGVGMTPVMETLSELRVLAIATGRLEDDGYSADEAKLFLDEVMARNLRYLVPTGAATEEERLGEDPYRESHVRLFARIAEEVGLATVLPEVVAEVEQVLAQRPIATWSVRRTLARAHRLVEREGLEGPAADRLRRLQEAATGPTPLSEGGPRVAAYREALAAADADALELEAEFFAASMVDTGLVAPCHAVLVRYLLDEAPSLLPTALGLEDGGALELEESRELVYAILRTAVHATTASCLLGLRETLERKLLSRTEVAAGLERFIGLEVRDEVADDLLAHRADDDEVTADAVLLAGVAAVLGQPLGVGQGRNPTCQSARGISMWAQHDPARLLELTLAAARDGRVELSFEGVPLRSDRLPTGIADAIDLDLDPVSIVLVPHLDRLYSELMRRASLRLQDAHRWVNPALYGRSVLPELASVFVDVAQTTVTAFDVFVRRFYATHHPAFNGGHRLLRPNPVGLVVTDPRGRYLGPHAVSIQRVDAGPDGEMRVYFYNPNNEGRQDWGAGVHCTVADHGEIPGESSLPFEDFASRLYAFHYNPQEEAPHGAVPDDAVQRIVEAARTTWGQRFTWL